MEQPKIKKQEIMPESVEEAVKLFVGGEFDENDAINYLRANRGEVTEFCLQTFEKYQGGDKSGIIKLGMIIDKLL
jgi:hypothetical protein